MTERTAEIDACDFCHLPEDRHPVDGCPGFEPEVSGDTNTVLDVGVPAKMTATIQLDLSKTEAIEQIGEFLESMNVVGLTIASSGKSVQCVGLVVSLRPADPIVDDTEESCPRCGHPSLDHYRGFCHHPAGAVAMCGCRTIPPEESP